MLLAQLWKIVGTYGCSAEQLMWSELLPDLIDAQTLKKLNALESIYLLEQDFIDHQLIDVVWWFVHHPLRQDWYQFTLGLQVHHYLLQDKRCDIQFIERRFPLNTSSSNRLAILARNAIVYARFDLLAELEKEQQGLDISIFRAATLAVQSNQLGMLQRFCVLPDKSPVDQNMLNFYHMLFFWSVVHRNSEIMHWIHQNCFFKLATDTISPRFKDSIKDPRGILIWDLAHSLRCSIMWGALAMYAAQADDVNLDLLHLALAKVVDSGEDNLQRKFDFQAVLVTQLLLLGKVNVLRLVANAFLGLGNKLCKETRNFPIKELPEVMTILCKWKSTSPKITSRTLELIFDTIEARAPKDQLSAYQLWEPLIGQFLQKTNGSRSKQDKCAVIWTRVLFDCGSLDLAKYCRVALGQVKPPLIQQRMYLGKKDDSTFFARVEMIKYLMLEFPQMDMQILEDMRIRYDMLDFYKKSKTPQIACQLYENALHLKDYQFVYEHFGPCKCKSGHSITQLNYHPTKVKNDLLKIVDWCFKHQPFHIKCPSVFLRRLGEQIERKFIQECPVYRSWALLLSQRHHDDIDCEDEDSGIDKDSQESPSEEDNEDCDEGEDDEEKDRQEADSLSDSPKKKKKTKR
jgi:hypothetical protein